MDYVNLESIQATTKSYFEAFTTLREYCENLIPTANQYNWRVTLPTDFSPSGQFDENKIRKHANFLSCQHAKLMDFDQPKYFSEQYTDWKEFFRVSWQLQIPFTYYAWEYAHSEYTDDVGILHPYIPPKMVKWDTIYLKLGEVSGWAMKKWALPDWWDKHQEIESFMDDNPTLKEQYRKSIAEADKDVQKWQSALQNMSKINIKVGGLT